MLVLAKLQVREKKQMTSRNDCNNKSRQWDRDIVLNLKTLLHKGQMQRQAFKFAHNSFIFKQFYQISPDKAGSMQRQVNDLDQRVGRRQSVVSRVGKFDHWVVWSTIWYARIIARLLKLNAQLYVQSLLIYVRKRTGDRRENGVSSSKVSWQDLCS